MEGGEVWCVCRCMSVFVVVIEILHCFILKVRLYVMKWKVTYKCPCMCWTFTSLCLSPRRRTMFYIGTLLIVCMCVRAQVCMCVHACRSMGVCVCVSFWWCGWVYTSNHARWCMSVLLFLMFVCLPLSRHFPCKIWWIKNLNLINSDRCMFCQTEKETVRHLLWKCT